MTSKEDFLQGEKMAQMPDSPVSSGDEDGGYEESSYGSDFQPPDLAPGFVHVQEDRCRAIYRKSRPNPDDPHLICLNSSTCRSLAGGQHPTLRVDKRAEPGVYEGFLPPTES